MNNPVGMVSRYQQEVQRLEQVWAQTCAGWQDKAQSDFEMRFWTEIAGEMRNHAFTLERLVEAIDQAHREVP